MKPVPEIDLLSNVSEVYFPVMWFDETAEIDQEWTKKFKNIVQVPFLLVDIFTYLGISVGAICVIGSVLSLII